MYGAELTQWRTDAMEARKRAYELTAEIATERNENARYLPESSSSGCSASEPGGFLKPVVCAGCGRRCGKRRLRLETPRGRTRRQAISFSASSLRALQPSPLLRQRWTNWRRRPKNHRQCTKQRCARANAIAQQLPCIPLRLPRMHISPPQVYSWHVQKDVDQRGMHFCFGLRVFLYSMHARAKPIQRFIGRGSLQHECTCANTSTICDIILIGPRDRAQGARSRAADSTRCRHH